MDERTVELDAPVVGADVQLAQLEQEALAEAEADDRGTPLEAENEGDDEEAAGDSSDEGDDVQIRIGDIKTNVPFQGGQKASAPATATMASKLDLEQTFEINGRPIFDIDLASVEKPWRKPGADITDYFNYGFTEDTWNQYCERQKKLRSEYGANASRVLFSSIIVSSASAVPQHGIPIIQSGEKKLPAVRIGGEAPKLIVNLAEKYNNPAAVAQTPMFRAVLTGAPTAIPTIGSTPSTSIPVLGAPLDAMQPMGAVPVASFTLPTAATPTMTQPTPSSSADVGLAPGVVDSDAEPLPPGSSTPPPGVDAASVAGPTPPRAIPTLGPPGTHIDVSVPPPRFHLPPPSRHPLAMHSMPPTNLPPPPFGHPMPPGVSVPPPGYPPQYPPPGIRPPPMMRFPGFDRRMAEGERSPASYSDKSSDLEDADHRERYRQARARRDYGGRAPRRSRSPYARRSTRPHRSDGTAERRPTRHRSRSASPHESSRSVRSRVKADPDEKPSSAPTKRRPSTKRSAADDEKDDSRDKKKKRRRRSDEEPSPSVGKEKESRRVKEEPPEADKDESAKKKRRRDEKKSTDSN